MSALSTSQPSGFGIITSSVIASGRIGAGQRKRLVAARGMHETIAGAFQAGAQELARRRIVVDDEDRGADCSHLAAMRGASAGLTGAGASLCVRQGDGEGRTFAGLAGDRDVAAEQLAEPPGNRQAEAGAAVFLGRGRIGLVNAWNSRPSCSSVMPMPVSETAKRTIGRSASKRSATRVSRPFSVNLLPLLRMLSRLCLSLVRSVRMLPRFVGGPEFERIAVLLGQRNDERPHLFEQRHDFDVFEKNVHLAGFDFRQIENVVDQAEQVTAGAFDLLEIADEIVLSEIGGVFLEDFAVADDGVERRAQLMAHIGEELRFVLARDLELAGACPRSRGTAARSGSPAPTAPRKS